jgi:hypothetical protein
MNPAPATPEPAKKTSGCLIALLIVGGVVALSCMIGGFFVWRATQSEEGKKIFGAMGKGLDVIAKAKKAPGTPELRAAGCRDAMVTDAREVLHVFDGFVDAGEVPLNDEKSDLLFITCEPAGDPLDCDRLAEIYVKAAKPDVGFTVIVSSPKSVDKEPDCSRRYDAAGKPVE